MKDKNDFRFIFNPQFAQTLDTEKFGFILAHETMHIVLNHLKLFQKGRFAHAPGCTDGCDKKSMKDKEGQVQICHDCLMQRRKLNVAADCVINDYLVNMGFTPVENLMYGEAVVGYNCAYSTVSDVFDNIPDDFMKCDGNCKPDDGSGQGTPCDGSCGKSKADDFDEIDSHDWMHDASEEQKEAADKAGQGNPHVPADLDRTKQDDDFKSDLNPGQGVGSKAAFSELEGVGLKWAEFLCWKRSTRSVFKQGPKPRASWHRNSRKMAAFRDSLCRSTLRARRASALSVPPSSWLWTHRGPSDRSRPTSSSTWPVRCRSRSASFGFAPSRPSTRSWIWTTPLGIRATHFDCITSYIEDVVDAEQPQEVSDRCYRGHGRSR